MTNTCDSAHYLFHYTMSGHLEKILGKILV